MNRTLLDDRFRFNGRDNWYISIAEIQRDLGEFMIYYNLKRSHHGYRVTGRTPTQALRQALGVETLPSLRFNTELESPTDSF